MNSKTSLYLGIIGGSLGFIYISYALFSGTADEAAYGEPFATGMAMAAMSFSTIAIVASVLVRQKPKLGGWIMIISGIAIPVFIGPFGLIPFLFIAFGGIIAVRSRNQR
ncbi:hypothetical protein [Salipaludibacillus sp. CF4.18]|uniref:hypothetical protein n=1 Tax=Salipaludibacillus sp. CF4.18 TaxID=3373081 RepID=UPI003EE6A664